MSERPLLRPSRRRLLGILAATPVALRAGAAKTATARRFRWRGTALGADAEIVLYCQDRDEAAVAVAGAVAEIERLEGEFSLYRADSALSRLNRDGRLERPSLDMVRLLGEARRWSEWTEGAFDVTVQPLWRLHARHFATFPDDRDGPPSAAVAEARSRVDFRRLGIEPGAISLAPGMAVTLNGIAQGYITDRVADLLRDRGFARVLVNLGELRGVGRRGDGSPWRAAIADPRHADVAVATVPLSDRALATSSGLGTRFDREGRHHHLFSPATGLSAGYLAAASVIADRATTADALSTALCVMPPRTLPPLRGRIGDAVAWLIHADGRTDRVRL